MALSVYLVGLPIVVMVVSVLLGGGNLQGQSDVYGICNQNAPNCTASGTTTITCAPNFFSFPCNIYSKGCLVPPYPAPAYCTHPLNVIFNFALYPAQTLLPAGTSITVPTVVVNQPSTSAGVFFAFGNVGSGGFIQIVGIVIGVVALAGLSVFGSGEQSESIHILFIGGLMLGVWLFLSAVDGVLSGTANSLFTQLNAPLVSPGGSNFGTELYVALTFMYLMGFLTMVKRGGGE